MSRSWLFRTVFIVFILFAVSLTSLYAQETLRDRIRERIMQRKIEQQQIPTGSPIYTGKIEKQSDYSAGYLIKTIKVSDIDRNETIVNIAIWYPATTQPMQSVYYYDDHAVKTKLSAGAKVAEGTFPLIIYSHGAGGCGLGSTFITEELAKAGFIVAAPDYPDRYYSCRMQGDVPLQKKRPLPMLKWLNDIRENQLNKNAKIFRGILSYRPEELRSVIDFMFCENKDLQSPFYNKISEGQIGLVGHSFGAWTSILVAGADLKFKDTRVGAVAVLSSPVNEYVYTVTSENELANINVPIMFMYGGKEKEVGRGSDYQYLYLPANPPKYIFEIPQAGHLSFSGGVRGEYNTIEEYKQDTIRMPIINLTVQFFKAYLDDDKESLMLLQNNRYDAVHGK